jgi:hypothetical protein
MDRGNETKGPRLRRTPKLSQQEQDELCERYQRGEETVEDLAAEYEIAIRTLYNYVEKKRKQLEGATL